MRFKQYYISVRTITEGVRRHRQCTERDQCL